MLPPPPPPLVPPPAELPLLLPPDVVKFKLPRDKVFPFAVPLMIEPLPGCWPLEGFELPAPAPPPPPPPPDKSRGGDCGSALTLMETGEEAGGGEFVTVKCDKLQKIIFKIKFFKLNLYK